MLASVCAPPPTLSGAALNISRLRTRLNRWSVKIGETTAPPVKAMRMSFCTCGTAVVAAPTAATVPAARLCVPPNKPKDRAARPTPA